MSIGIWNARGMAIPSTAHAQFGLLLFHDSYSSKWIKRHLRIKRFLVTSENAVRSQI
jgi:hypothetical protein